MGDAFHSSLAAATEDRLRKEIFIGELPPGTRLAEAAEARRLGVSRVPVREALFALERDGLVKFSESGRAYVNELSSHDFEELYTLRLALEPLGARLAAHKLKADLSALERNVQATRDAKTLRNLTCLDLDFHELILQASDNARLLKLWRSLRSELELWLGQLHRKHHANHLDTQGGTAGAHEEIIRCIRNATPDACERLMREHVQGWREWLPFAQTTPIK
jgi:DNA-binding GntR family transcriptional regulator